VVYSARWLSTRLAADRLFSEVAGDVEEHPRTFKWWSWGESNPRPKAFAGQIYTLSWLIWI